MELYPVSTTIVDDLCLMAAVKNRLLLKTGKDTVSYATSRVLDVHVDETGRVFVKTQNVVYEAHVTDRNRGLLNFLRKAL